jgi:ferredoxin, 2Fe-2S
MMAVRSADGLETSKVSGDEKYEIHVYDERGTHVVMGNAGETLLSAMLRHGIAIGSVCGGNMICGTCHIWLNVEAGSDYPPPAPEEIELLQLSNFFEPRRSRLACQMRIPRGIHDLCLEVAPDE